MVGWSIVVYIGVERDDVPEENTWLIVADRDSWESWRLHWYEVFPLMTFTINTKRRPLYIQLASDESGRAEIRDRLRAELDPADFSDDANPLVYHGALSIEVERLTGEVDSEVRAEIERLTEGA